ncbi:MAG: hypothetical protein WBM44_27095 [Waterburya sp.]
MSNSSLTLDQLKDLRTSLRRLRNTIFTRRENLIIAGQIDQEQFIKMIEAEDSISKLIDQINDGIFSTITTDLNNAVVQIQFSIDKANQAIAELQNINKMLQFVNSIVNLSGSLLNVITTPNIANIAGIINQIASL